MPSKSRRAPIDYQPQFGAGIFRSPEAVAEELAELTPDTYPGEREDVSLEGQEVAPTLRRDNSRSKTRTNEALNERTNARTRVRHSFDIFQDQLLALTEIQTERFTRTGRKPKLGELVQEALDTYITSQRKRTTVRTNGRTEE